MRRLEWFEVSTGAGVPAESFRPPSYAVAEPGPGPGLALALDPVCAHAGGITYRGISAREPWLWFRACHTRLTR